MEEAHPIGELTGKAHLVGHHQHRQIVRLAEAADDIEHFAAELRVQSRGHFVEQHHLRPHRQCAGNRHALLLTARELRREVFELVFQADHGQQFFGAFAGFGLAQAEHLDRRFHDVLQGVHMGEQVEALEHHADLATHPSQVTGIGRDQLAAGVGHVRQRLAVDLDHALVDSFQGH